MKLLTIVVVVMAVSVHGTASAAGVASSWKIETVDGAPELPAVTSSPGGEIWAVGKGGLAYHRDAKGRWTVEKTGTTVDLVDVTAERADDVWAVGGAGAIVHRDGKAWGSIPSGDDDPWVAVAAVAGKTACAVGELVATWSNAAWRPIKGRPKFAGLAAVTAVRVGKGGKRVAFVAVGSGGQAILITGAGSDGTFVTEQTGVTGDLAGVASCPGTGAGGDVVAVGAVAARRVKGKWRELATPPVPVRGAVVRCKGTTAVRVAAVAGAELFVLDVAKNSWTRGTVAANAVLLDVAPFGKRGLVVSGAAGVVATLDDF